MVAYGAICACLPNLMRICGGHPTAPLLQSVKSPNDFSDETEGAAKPTDMGPSVVSPSIRRPDFVDIGILGGHASQYVAEVAKCVSNKNAIR